VVAAPSLVDHLQDTSGRPSKQQKNQAEKNLYNRTGHFLSAREIVMVILRAFDFHKAKKQQNTTYFRCLPTNSL